VANSFFPDDPNTLLDLEGPRNDPAILRDVLIEEGVGLFSSDNVRPVAERTQTEILREIEDLFATATARDTVMLYYSGHGQLDTTNGLYLCARDTRTDRLRSTAVSGAWISDTIDQSAAGTTIIVLDCCHSGAFKGGDIEGTLAGRGRFVLGSTRASDLARDTDTRNRASVFTAAFVEALRSGASDANGDGAVMLSDVYRYVHNHLTNVSSQVPMRRFDGTGEVPIAMRLNPQTSVSTRLIDPSDTQPILDVSPSEFDLGDVELGERLPPERVAVINRGGGVLQWSVDVSDPWVVADTEDFGVELRLTPGPDSRRANVYIRDSASGAMKTIRLRVRVVDRGKAAGGDPRRVKQAQKDDQSKPQSARVSKHNSNLAPVVKSRSTGLTRLPELLDIPAGRSLFGSDRVWQRRLKTGWFSRPMALTELHLPTFRIARFPVTNRQFFDFVQATRREAPKHWPNGQPKPNELDFPVVWISRATAVAYCTWLSTSSGTAHRLPTEQEWEKAARGIDERPYPWGEAWDVTRCHAGSSSPVEVTRHSPIGDSPFGIADMVGNAREWTATTNDSVRTAIVRGGGYRTSNVSPDIRLTCMFREIIADGPKATIGFRVAAD
jgi:formylglycine-generating enzyme required for sulfatase activity